ncbi:MAG: putative DNA binding domain-containing protein [Eubacteriales bacterium]|nr:putative DNA binding domain-containing protein [Eubacteriales bacterium]
MQYESERIEYKSQMIDDIYKEVIAFANTDGGIIYLGIDDKGNLTGIENVDETYTRLTNGIRDAIAPDVTMFVRYVLQDNKVIQIEVGEGSFKPYYLKAKGMKPTGVYVRQGASSVQASPEQIRQMIKESDGDTFEEARCLEQDLTFDAAGTAFKRYGVEFSVEKYRALGITQNDIYTNLALLLSDQCLHTTKIAVFNDESCTEFRDSKEFGGSVFKQFEDSVNYLALCNKTISTIKGVIRTDKQDYPEEAIREALLNALVHRDYSFSGSIIINVNDSKMEFISLGGLLPGLSTEDIRIGVSQPRNKKLAEVFHRLRLIESYGTGIRRIFKLYENCAIQPRIEVTANAFKIVLPNMNASGVAFDSASETNEKSPAAITPQMKAVIDYLTEYGEMTDEDLQELLNIKKTRAYLLARQMNENELIEIVGRGAGKKYKLK